MCPACRHRANANCAASVPTTSKPQFAGASACAVEGARRPIAIGACDLGEAALIEAHRALEAVCRRNTYAITRYSAAELASPNAAAAAAAGTNGSPFAIPDAVPDGERLTAFHSKNPPKDLSLFALGSILLRSTRAGDATLWEAVVLFVRFCGATDTPPTVHLMHRLYAACVHLAIKVHDDRYFTVFHFARLAGVPEREMACLEAALLDGVAWRCLVTSDDVAALSVDSDMYVAPLPRVVIDRRWNHELPDCSSAEAEADADAGLTIAGGLLVLPSPEVTGGRSGVPSPSRSPPPAPPLRLAGAHQPLLVSSWHDPAPHCAGSRSVVDLSGMMITPRLPVIGDDDNNSGSGSQSPQSPATPHQSPVSASASGRWSPPPPHTMPPPPPAPIAATPDMRPSC